jgi:hypothetical protein
LQGFWPTCDTHLRSPTSRCEASSRPAVAVAAICATTHSALWFCLLRTRACLWVGVNPPWPTQSRSVFGTEQEASVCHTGRWVRLGAMRVASRHASRRRQPTSNSNCGNESNSTPKRCVTNTLSLGRHPSAESSPSSTLRWQCMRCPGSWRGRLLRQQLPSLLWPRRAGRRPF